MTLQCYTGYKRKDFVQLFYNLCLKTILFLEHESTLNEWIKYLTHTIPIFNNIII